jgi:S-adenosylmethionine-diacylgycerolhomoserine-N-methlytransferase
MSNTSVLTPTHHSLQAEIFQPTQAQKMSAYYRFHAKIYDLTRWTFLFGRHWVIDWLPFERLERFTLLEVGCGTGHNLKYLAQCFPKAQLMGMDASADMLHVAQNKFETTYNKPLLINKLYGKGHFTVTPSRDEAVGIRGLKKPQVILFSYCLTMVNPYWEMLILQAKEDLAENGYITVVDFHNSPSRLFKRWMGKNHVRMDGHILPFLQNNFDTVKYEIRRAYFGLWHYTLYIGKKVE